ncbi:hypothetical protein [Alteraurantiacibacter buctensis]|uniref:Uncharacterized protein n=1 Tax=Alteraurantiacibacter buctensis TaxID=1503981 RepID=A0A844YYD3_9SPHN|nr:hypothetical protein [Alteraurantiacibacter buctensis]MXO73345.1 hypothetical protein [Alteraurantiacibacter buctensis]
MDIINIRSSVTLLVCCVAAAGFFLDQSPRRERAAEPRVVQAPAPAPVPTRAANPAPMPDLKDNSGPAGPETLTPAATRAPQIGAGVRLASPPQQPVSAEAAERALAEDLQAALD